MKSPLTQKDYSATDSNTPQAQESDKRWFVFFINNHIYLSFLPYVNFLIRTFGLINCCYSGFYTYYLRESDTGFSSTGEVVQRQSALFSRQLPEFNSYHFERKWVVNEQDLNSSKCPFSTIFNLSSHTSLGKWQSLLWLQDSLEVVILQTNVLLVKFVCTYS